VAVTGTTGKVGRLAVQQLSAQGYQVRCLSRHEADAAAPSSAADASPAAVTAWVAALPGVTLVPGDVTDAESVRRLMEGCDACLALHGSRRISQLSDLWQDPTSDPKHPKSVNCVGVGHVIQAARDSGTCKRVVRLTGKGERPWDLFSILLNGLGSMAKAWNYEGEMLLRACPDVEYTIIRPGVMGPMSELPPASLALADNGGDLKVSAIPHAAVADLSIRVLGQPNAARATLCAMTVPEGEGADDWQALLESVSPDTRSFRGHDLFEEAELAVRVGLPALAAVAIGLAIGLLAALRGLLPV